MQAALLSDRGVIRVSGDEARAFLDRLVTSSVDTLQPGAARFCALLTPQGKIIVDFIVTEAATDDGGGFYIDVPRALAPELTKRLTFYKLRAKVTIEDLSDRLGVMAVWGDDTTTTEHGLCYPDPRLPALGLRVILPPDTATEAAADLGAALALDDDSYDAHRIALGIPRGGHDFIYGDVFPHETDMDQLGGVDFAKGCFIGQEVVSRMEHRGTARTRIVPIRYADASPLPGLPVVAGEKNVGALGSTAKGRGLALLRLDRVGDAMAQGTPISAGGVEIWLEKPRWARFRFPGEQNTPA
ncbi:MAG: folate-binding protein YgfZ [Rhizobiales bacterium]|nr:folate-binding protein YgfZ [Hyphomicrobiales bacterium]OJY44892.1 MAG: folate-binding protein YgfZ [Rhizobiales bacterium 64-17]